MKDHARIPWRPTKAPYEDAMWGCIVLCLTGLIVIQAGVIAYLMWFNLF